MRRMTNKDLAASLVSIMKDAFDQPDLQYRPRVMMRDVAGFESVHFVQMILALELEFGFELHEDEVDAIYTMGDVFALLRRKVPETD